ncbi:MAG: site-specific integrase [Stenomitos rutilans HA7619-LM2]|jgi:integrase|nr:site-specific integrase [Stenomitos rutilans HA7619-LM2]
MYSKKNPKKPKRGAVKIKVSRYSLQLVFSYEGKRFYLSPGLRDTPYERKKAQDIAFELERDIDYGQFDPNNLEKYKVEPALTNADVDTAPSTPILDLSELWNRYQDTKKAGKSPATIRMYGWVANHLERCPYKQPIEAQAIFDWINANVPADSAKRVLMHLSACCKWARKLGTLDLNPFEGMASEVKVKKAGTEEDEVFPFTTEERDRIIAAFKSSRYYRHYASLVEFLFFTGCRPSEAIALRWKHINRAVITFEQAVIYDGQGLVLKDGLKTQKARRFPINAQLTTLIEAIKPEDCDPSALVFPSPKGKFIDWHNFTGRAWKNVLNSLADVAYRNPYQTRHTFCSLCREQNIPSIQISKWAGNSAQMIDRCYAKAVENVTVPDL